MREDIRINLQMIGKASYVIFHQKCANADRNRRKGNLYYLSKPPSFGVTMDIYLYIYI